MVLKKKEIIAASLVVLIGVAGYLNWSYQDTIRVQDGESYVETGKKLGEAQYVSSDTVAEETSTDNAEQNDGEQAEETAVTEDNGEQATDSQESNVTVETASDSGNYFEQAKMNKETSRSKSLEILNQTAENESFDADIRKKAGDKILEEANNVQKESEIESIADSSLNVAKAVGRRNEQNVEFPEFIDEKLQHMMAIVDEALVVMCANLTIEYKEVKAKKAYEVEQTINDYRTILQQEHLTAIEEKKYDYATGIIYSDIFFECEKIGDYAINVTEAIKEIGTDN